MAKSIKISVTVPTGEKMDTGKSFRKPSKSQEKPWTQYNGSTSPYESEVNEGNLLPQHKSNFVGPKQTKPTDPRTFGKAKMAAGGSFQGMQGGGEVEGPSHEDGGVPVQDESGEEIAEVEGGERIFSTEDTQMLEQAAAQIMELAQQDPAQADEAAKQLGYSVVEMLMRQEDNQQAQMGGQPAGGGNDMIGKMANQFV